jgi:hypothetical protein
MKGRLTRSVLLAVLLLAAAVMTWAQANTGQIAGKVLDEKGQPIPGASVTVSSKALQGDRGTATDLDGAFLVPFLPPASDYQVKVEAVGFNKVVQSNISVQLGSTTTLNVALTSGSQTVTVTARPPMVSLKNTQVSDNITQEQLDMLPLGRGYQDALFLAPTAVDAGAGGNPGIAGASANENIWQINGLNTTDIVTGTFGTNLNYNFVREIDVTTGGIPAEYSGSTGGLFNVLTKSGSNEFHGELFGYYTNQNATAKGLPVYGGGLTESSFDRYDYGFDVGGPILKDRLWYFVAYNPTVSDTRYQGVFNETSYINPPGSPFHTLNLPYNYTDSRKSWLWSFKLNFRLNEKHNFELTAYGDPYKAHIPSDGLYPTINPLSDQTTRNQGGYNWIARWYATWTSTFYSETSFGRAKDILQVVPSSNAGWGYPVEVSDDWSPGLSVGPGMGVIDSDTRNSTQLMNKETWILGNHEIKFGGEMTWIHFYGFLGYPGNSYNILVNGPAGYPSSDMSQYYYDVRYSLQNPLSDSKGRYYAGFLQDKWSITNYLNLSAGVRWEENLQEPSQAPSFSVRSTSPRVGLSWDFAHDGKSKLYINYGEYSEIMPVQLANNMAPGHAQYIDYYNYGRQIAHFLSGSVPFKVYGNPKDQYSREWLAGFEYEIAPSFTVGARIQYRDLARAIDTYGYLDKQGNLDFLIVNPGMGSYPASYMANWINAQDISGHPFNDFSPFSKPIRLYRAFTLTADKRFSNNWFMNASVTWSRLEGNYTGAAYGYGTTAFNYGPNATGTYVAPFRALEQNTYGLLPQDVPVDFKLQGAYRFNFGLTLGASIELASGRPYNKYVAFPSQELESGQNIFVAPRGSARLPSWYEVDLHAEYAFKLWRLNASVVANVFNLTNVQHPLSVYETYYKQPNTWEQYASGNLQLDPNYGTPTSRQAPRSVQAGLKFTW